MLLRHALPLMLALLYFAHAVLVAIVFDDLVAWLVVASCTLAIVFYYAGFSLARRLFPRRTLVIPRGGLFGPGAIAACFIAVASGLVVTAPELAIMVSASGGDVNEIAGARESFTKTREGFEQVLAYTHAMMLKGVLPLALIALFVLGHRLRWLFLTIAIALLLASLEKFLTALVLIPIGIYFGLIGDYKRLLSFLVFAFAMFMVAASLSRVGSDLDGLAEMPGSPVGKQAAGASPMQPGFVVPDRVLEKLATRHEPVRVAALSDVPFYQAALVGVSTDLVLVNRAVWIPFVTVYDTFRYWLEMQDGRHLLGITSRPVALVHGVEVLNLEREVFRFQFGGNEDTTGNSNAAFFADAYVNFGVFGIIGFALLVGGILGWISTLEHPACSAAGAVLAFGFAGSAVLPMLWSGGVWLFVLVVLAWSRRARRSTGRLGSRV